MSNWLTSIKNANLDELVDKFRRLMVPKSGKSHSRALGEIRKQRRKRLEQIEKLRAEAGALFVLERELASTSQKLPVTDLL